MDWFRVVRHWCKLEFGHCIDVIVCDHGCPEMPKVSRCNRFFQKVLKKSFTEGRGSFHVLFWFVFFLRITTVLFCIFKFCLVSFSYPSPSRYNDVTKSLPRKWLSSHCYALLNNTKQIMMSLTLGSQKFELFQKHEVTHYWPLEILPERIRNVNTKRKIEFSKKKS